MTWTASIATDETGLRLRFDRPVRVLEMSRETARELAAVLLVAAEVDDTDEQADATG